MPVGSYAAERIIQRDGRTVTKAAASLPATTTTTWMTIAGEIELERLVFVVGTAIQNQACNLTVNWTPTGGSAIALCTATNIANLSSAAEIALMPLTVAGAVQSLTLTLVGSAWEGLAALPFRLGAGVISLTTSATNTGTIATELRYRPVNSAGNVIAA